MFSKREKTLRINGIKLSNQEEILLSMAINALLLMSKEKEQRTGEPVNRKEVEQFMRKFKIKDYRLGSNDLMLKWIANQ